VECARRYGIRTALYVMVGLPGETLADFRQTVEVARKCKPNECILNIFYPYPGTELARLCEEKQLLDTRIDIRRVCDRKKPVLDLPHFRQGDVLRSYIWFDRNVFRGHRPLHKILLRVLQSWVFTSPALERFFNSVLDIGPLFRLKSKLIKY
jgi:anaerobic magnesium-protoporphyrin IX monomethyl ester cyclase